MKDLNYLTDKERAALGRVQDWVERAANLDDWSVRCLLDADMQMFARALSEACGTLRWRTRLLVLALAGCGALGAAAILLSVCG